MNKWSPNTSILEIYTEIQIHSLKVDLTRNFPYLEDFNYIYHPCNKYNHILNARQTNCIISQLPIGFKTSVLYSIRLINQPNSFIVEAGKKTQSISYKIHQCIKVSGKTSPPNWWITAETNDTRPNCSSNPPMSTVNPSQFKNRTIMKFTKLNIMIKQTKRFHHRSILIIPPFSTSHNQQFK